MPAPPSNPTLSDLEALVGTWDIEVPQFGGPKGRATIDWLEGGAFLCLRMAAPDPAPNSTWIIGRDDSGDRYTALYADTRGVSRVYQMSFDRGAWTLWRDAPGFNQRFSATLQDGGRSIHGAWEMSADGETWNLDFEMRYSRVD